MSSASSRTSSSKKVSILYGSSPRTSNDSLASRSSSEYSNSSRYSPGNMTSVSTYGGSSTRYDGYSGSALSRSSRSSNQSTSGEVVERLVRDTNPTTASPHGYYTKERQHTSGKTVTVHNHGKKSARDDEPRTPSSYRR